MFGLLGRFRRWRFGRKADRMPHVELLKAVLAEVFHNVSLGEQPRPEDLRSKYAEYVMANESWKTWPDDVAETFLAYRKTHEEWVTLNGFRELYERSHA